MEHSSPYRPRVSRETRLLLTTALLAMAALWILARARFPERPVTPNPVPPILTQLAAGPVFGDLASEIAELQARLEPVLLALPGAEAAVGRVTFRSRPALRIRDDVAVTMRGASPAEDAGLDVIVDDPGSGLALVRVASAPALSLVTWAPRQPLQPRYLAAADVSVEAVSLAPIFIGSLESVPAPAWPDRVWAPPARADLQAGSFVFTLNGELAGLVIPHQRGRAIVPGNVVLTEAERLLAQPRALRGYLGIRADHLTPVVALATGASAGVVVTRVDQAAGVEDLLPGDVIEAADGQKIHDLSDWQVRAARLSAGDTMVLNVRRQGLPREVTLVASAPAAANGRAPLGLTARGVSGRGTEVIRVEAPSAAAIAGLLAGDVITVAGDIQAPTPAQIRRAFGRANGAPLLIVYARGATHHVTALVR